jgi:hypothetical protein
MPSKNPRFAFPLPGRYSQSHVKKFPYDVWYVTDGDSVVIACIHSKMDGPSIVRKTLRTLEE